jgi:hypothetical protein
MVQYFNAGNDVRIIILQTCNTYLQSATNLLAVQNIFGCRTKLCLLNKGETHIAYSTSIAFTVASLDRLSRKLNLMVGLVH